MPTDLFVAERAKGTGSSGAGTTVPFSVTGVTVGNKLILSVPVSPPGSSTLGVTSITDDHGNTWTVDVTATASATGSVHGIAVCSCDVAAVGASGALTVTIHLSASGAVAYKLEEFSGVGAFDVGVANHSNASTSLATSLATPAGAGELAVAAFGPPTSEASFTPGFGYTQAGTPRGASPDVAVEYDLSAPAGSQNATATVPSAGIGNYAHALAFYLVPNPSDTGLNTQTVTPSKAKEARADSGRNTETVAQAKVREAVGSAQTNAVVVAASAKELLQDAGRVPLALLLGTVIGTESVDDHGLLTQQVTQKLRESRRDTGRNAQTFTGAGAAAAVDDGGNILAVTAALETFADTGLNTVGLLIAAVAAGPSEHARAVMAVLQSSPFQLQPAVDSGLNTLTVDVPTVPSRPVPPVMPVPPYIAAQAIALLEDTPDFTPPIPADLKAGQLALWFDGLNGVLVLLGRTLEGKIVGANITLDPDPNA